MKWIKKLLGYCYSCQRYFVYPKQRRQNTAYIDDKLNFITCCKDCFAEAEDYNKQRWDDYNSGRL